MNIVYALTHNYYKKILPSIKSLVHYHPDAKIFILAEDDEVPKLPVPCTVINVKEQKYFDHNDVNYDNMFTYINLLKVCYPSILPVEKVLHLDVDTIICDILEPLWNIDLTDKWFAACPEYHGVYRPFGFPYYNAGVILLNLEQMRKDNIEPQLVKYLKSTPQPWADQDAWNWAIIGNDKAVSFDVRYNENQMTGTTNQPAIVHYCAIPNWYENLHMPRREFLDEYM